MIALSSLSTCRPNSGRQPAARRLWLKGVAALCLTFFSFGAQAHILDPVITAPDCDTSTIKFSFSTSNTPAGEPLLFVDWELYLAPTDGSPVVALSGRYEFNSLDGPNPTGMFTIDVPELAGNSFVVSGNATLRRVGGTWNTVDIVNGAGEVNYPVDCTPPPPQLASLGDRVWEDRNGNGVQDCSDDNNNGIIGDPGDSGPECDAGIPNVPVDLLFGDCQTPTGMGLVTDNDGFYNFTGLEPGDYCVDFGEVPADICVTDGYDLGAPVFTTPNVGDDATDSDAGENGITDPINLGPGDNDLTIDAGVVCPVKIGDLVWLDEDRDGVQDPSEPGVPDVKTTLFECGPDMIAGTPDDVMTGEMRFTDVGGMYMYGAEQGYVLQPGKYYVGFDLPDGFDFTTPNAGGDPALDSNCMPDTGITACVDLTASRTIDLTTDCGITPPPPPVCDLTVNKTCAINEPPPSDYECNKPIDSLSMIWNGQDNVRVIAYKGDTGEQILGDVTGVLNGDVVTISGFAGSPNDVFWEIFDATGTKLGESVFHLSCSDDDMNGPEDCGKPQGDGKSGSKSKDKDKDKDKDGGDSSSPRLNDWILEGIVDAGGVLSCSGGDNGGDIDFPTGESCSFSTASADVIYGYVVTNNGDGVSGIILTDDQLGTIGGPFDLGTGESAEYTATATIFGTTTNVATATGDVAGEACVAMDTLTVDKVTPPGSCDDGKATELVFEFTGDACSASTSDQEGKFECSPENVELAALASVTIDEDADEVSAEINGNTVRIFRSDDIGDKLNADTTFTLTDVNGTSQSLNIHTSCSKRLEVGDQFGALNLIQLINEF